MQAKCMHVPLPSLSALSSPLPARMFGIEKKTFNLLSDSNEITKPVVFMGETLTCPPGFLGGSAPVISLSRYKFQAARHRLCGDYIGITEQLFPTIVTNCVDIKVTILEYLTSTAAQSSLCLHSHTLPAPPGCEYTFQYLTQKFLLGSQILTLACGSRDAPAGRLEKN